MSDRDEARLERIRLRAYEIWQDAGCPEGADLEHWAVAESQEVEDGTSVDIADNDSFFANDPPANTAMVRPT